MRLFFTNKNAHLRNVLGLDSSTGRATDRYPEGASSNAARVNIFQLTSTLKDYHEKFLFMCISVDDSEIKFSFSATFKNESLVEILKGLLPGDKPDAIQLSAAKW